MILSVKDETPREEVGEARKADPGNETVPTGSDFVGATTPNSVCPYNATFPNGCSPRFTSD